VGAGAFGAHALKSRLPDVMVQAFETGARYQMYHGLGLLALAALMGQGQRLQAPAGLMLAGVLLFCGSLYAMALTGIRALGAVTPVGGICLLIAWGWVVVASLAGKTKGREP
jgi:uncharacterized membrane protein YgdD (TMEM256/DUF423 family)